jgi:GT2 family glycosyltransferase
MAPTVSVIIVSYQTRTLTLRCLAGLRSAGSRVPHEIILVDNASTDGSADAVAEEFPEVTLVRLARNVGFGRAVNAGAALAHGRWLMLLNPDAEPVRDVLAAFTEFALASPAHGIYSGRTLRPDGTDDGRSCFALPSVWSLFCFAAGLSTFFRRVRWLNPEELPDLDRSKPAPVPAASGCLLLVDRALFSTLGGFTPDYFMYSEDVDLCARAVAHGAHPVLVPEAKVVHVGGASSTSANKRIMVLRGKCTYLRLRWSRPRAAVGRTLLLSGVAMRAAGARLTGRADYWREVWTQHAVWRAGWPRMTDLPLEHVDDAEVVTRPGLIP